MEQEYKVRFVISTNAGKGYLGRTLEEKIRDVYQNQPLPDIAFTERKHHVHDLCVEWAERYGSKGIVYVCGGDGTISEASAALKYTGTYMGVIPIGTGNDFSRVLYQVAPSPKLVEKLIDKTLSPKLGVIDLLKLNEGSSINIISTGLDTIVLENALSILEKWSGWGKLSYTLGIFKSMFGDYQKVFPIKYSVELEDGQKLEGKMDAISAVIANGQYYGSGFRAAPHADINDGLGEIILIEKLSVKDFWTLILKYRKGTHLDHPKVKTYSFVKARVENCDGSNMHANFDGILTQPKALEVEVMDDALAFAFLQ